MGSFDFENLNLYQKSLEFINLVYKQTNAFPKDEIYGLTSQYRRAANSIALNFRRFTSRVCRVFFNCTFSRIYFYN